MAWTKAKVAVAVGVIALVTAGTATVAIRQIQEHRTYAWEVRDAGKFQQADFAKTPQQVKILATKYPEDPNGWQLTEDGKNGRLVGVKMDVTGLIQTAFQIEQADRIIYPAELPQGKFDFIANQRSGAPAALQEEIKRKFGLTGKLEMVETNVLLLRVKSPESTKLEPSTAKAGRMGIGPGAISATRETMPALATLLSTSYFKIPVMDRTGLKDAFDFKLEWDGNGGLDKLKEALTEQLGLELVPGRESVEMLVVEKGE